jgi:uncharacterized protein (TIGR02588 family)
MTQMEAPYRDQRADAPRPDQPGRSVAEWTTFTVSAVTMLALVGMIIYQHFIGSNRPAIIEVQPRFDEVQQQDVGYYVPIEIANRGDRTARDVRVHLSLQGNEEQRASSLLLVDYLAGGSEHRGVVIMSSHPSGSTLRVDSITYLEP